MLAWDLRLTVVKNMPTVSGLIVQLPNRITCIYVSVYGRTLSVTRCYQVTVSTLSTVVLKVLTVTW